MKASQDIADTREVTLGEAKGTTEPRIGKAMTEDLDHNRLDHLSELQAKATGGLLSVTPKERFEARSALLAAAPSLITQAREAGALRAEVERLEASAFLDRHGNELRCSEAVYQEIRRLRELAEDGKTAEDLAFRNLEGTASRADHWESQAQALREENEALRLAHLGGEDAPGYAASLPLAEVLRSIKDCDTARTAERDALKARVEDWKPIETAPRDGTEILIYGETNSWEDDDRHHARMFRAHWWALERRWSGHGIPECDYRPTHWRHLPEPPVALALLNPTEDRDDENLG